LWKLGELEIAVETLAFGSCSDSISRFRTLPLVFLQPDRNTQTVFDFLNKIIIKGWCYKFLTLGFTCHSNWPTFRVENSENAGLYYELNDVIRIKQLVFRKLIDILTGISNSPKRRKHFLLNPQYYFSVKICNRQRKKLRNI
jgi:hypothetical protein